MAEDLRLAVCRLGGALADLCALPAPLVIDAGSVSGTREVIGSGEYFFTRICIYFYVGHGRPDEIGEPSMPADAECIADGLDPVGLLSGEPSRQWIGKRPTTPAGSAIPFLARVHTGRICLQPGSIKYTPAGNYGTVA